jgi:hypothetical protein
LILNWLHTASRICTSHSFINAFHCSHTSLHHPILFHTDCMLVCRICYILIKTHSVSVFYLGVFRFMVCVLDKCGCSGDLIGFLVAREISGRVFLCEMIRVFYHLFWFWFAIFG